MSLIGAPAELVIGKTDHELFPDDIADRYQQHDREVVHTGGVMSFKEDALLNHDPRFYVVRKFPLRDEGGWIVAKGGVATDMTTRLQAERPEIALRVLSADVPRMRGRLHHRGVGRWEYGSSRMGDVTCLFTIPLASGYEEGPKRESRIVWLARPGAGM